MLARIENAKEFVLAGNASFTLRSTVTGVSYAYTVTRHKHKAELFFVKCGDHYLGVITFGVFQLTRSSKYGVDSPEAKAFTWSFARIITGDPLPHSLELWHEGRCGKCGKLLTTPISVARGFGPKCVQGELPWKS